MVIPVGISTFGRIPKGLHKVLEDLKKKQTESEVRPSRL